MWRKFQHPWGALGCSTLQTGQTTLPYREPGYKKHSNTHNNQHEWRRPNHQRLWPSPSMGRPAAPPTNGAATPYGPMQDTRHWVRRHRCWYPCLGRRNATHQKIERERWGLGLRWPPIDQVKQQSNKLGGTSRWDVRAEARWAGSAWRTPSHCLGW